MTESAWVTLLRNEKKRRGLSNVKVGELIGRSDVTIGNWLRGINSPDADSISGIAKFLGLSEVPLNASIRGENVEERQLLLDRITQILVECSSPELDWAGRLLQIALEKPPEANQEIDEASG